MEHKPKERNLSELNKIILENIMPFIKAYKPSIIFIVAILVCFRLKNYYNERFKYDRILNVINKKSRYVGNAVLIRDKYFITPLNNITKTCVKTKPEDNIYYYIVMNNIFYRVNLVNFDFSRNLALLQIYENPRYPEFNTKNFAMFSVGQVDLLNSKVFISKSLNDPVKSMFFDSYKVNNISNQGLAIKSFDNIRNNVGEIVLNDKLEFVGITAGNSSRGGLFSKLNNKIEIIDSNKIKSFLRELKFYYYENKQNIDLYSVKNYLPAINARFVCYVDIVPNRLFRTIRRQI